MAKDCISEDIKIGQLRAEYKAAAVVGDRIKPILYINDGSHIVELTDGVNKTYAVIEFK